MDTETGGIAAAIAALTSGVVMGIKSLISFLRGRDREAREQKLADDSTATIMGELRTIGTKLDQNRAAHADLKADVAGIQATQRAQGIELGHLHEDVRYLKRNGTGKVGR